MQNLQQNLLLQNGFTPLHVCAENDEVNVAVVLAEYGSEFAARADGGLEPLHVAAKFGNLNITKFLIGYHDTPDQVCSAISSVNNFRHFFLSAISLVRFENIGLNKEIFLLKSKAWENLF